MSRAFISIVLCSFLLGVFEVAGQAGEGEADNAVDAIRQEVLRLRGRLEALSIEGIDKDRALRQVDRLISSLEASEGTEDPSPAIPAFQTVGRDVAYFRWDRLDQKGLESLLAGLAARENWAGIVMDFRFCAEGDWDAFGAVASLFVDDKTELIRRGEETLVSLPGSQRWRRSPRVVLVNRETAGPAEAVAAVLSERSLAVLVGESTARDDDAPGWEFADGSGFEGSVRPDIPVAMDLEAQREVRLVEASQSLSRQLQGTRAFQDAVLENLSRFGSLPELEPSSVRDEESGPVVDLQLERAVDLIRATGLALRRSNQGIRR